LENFTLVTNAFTKPFTGHKSALRFGVETMAETFVDTRSAHVRIPIVKRDKRGGICGYPDAGPPQYTMDWHRYPGGLSKYTVISRLTGRILVNMFVDWYPNAPLGARVKRRSVA
jgi:hypothetical protein